MDGQVESVLRQVARVHPSSRELRARLVRIVQAQADALVATGALAADDDPLPPLRQLLASRGLLAADPEQSAPPPPQWVQILDAAPQAPPRLLAVVPVLWNPPVLRRGALWVSAVELWSDGLTVTWTAAGAHGLWHLAEHLRMEVVDGDGTSYEYAGAELGSAGATRVAGRRDFAPAIPSHVSELIATATCGSRSARRVIRVRT
jgi:hypothetical protein